MTSELETKIDESLAKIKQHYEAAKLSTDTLYENVVNALVSNILFLKNEIKQLEDKIDFLTPKDVPKPPLKE
jgi:uncharacterized protein Yka (UPF0111/DUF47 family)